MTTVADKPAPAAAAPVVMTLPCEITLVRAKPLQVLLIGAGGTGARLATDVARLLSNGDRLVVADHDRVEDKNLVRQHFVRGDVGRYKAEVVARRALAAAPPGVTVEPLIAQVGVAHLGAYGTQPLLIIGAVDNRATRRLLHLSLFTGSMRLWVDAGNELRGGQVGIAGEWPTSSLRDPGGTDYAKAGWAKVQACFAGEVGATARVNDYYAAYCAYAVFHGIAEQTPLILAPDVAAEAATPDCDIRVDTQSLAANVMAYAAVINIVSRVLDELPLAAGMTFFSTQNTMKPALFTSVSKGEGDRRWIVSTIGTTTRAALQGLVK